MPPPPQSIVGKGNVASASKSTSSSTFGRNRSLSSTPDEVENGEQGLIQLGPGTANNFLLLGPGSSLRLDLGPTG